MGAKLEVWLGLALGFDSVVGRTDASVVAPSGNFPAGLAAGSRTGLLSLEANCGAAGAAVFLPDGDPSANGRSVGSGVFTSRPELLAELGRNGLADATMTGDGAGAGEPSRKVASSMRSSLPSIGAGP